MDDTTWSIPSDAGLLREPDAMTSLYEALRKLPDPRRRQGKRYDLALILCLLILAKLAGQTSLSGATEWIRHRAPSLAQRFGLCRKSMPCQMTYCNVLARVDGKHLDEILYAFACRDGKRKAAAETNPVARPPPQGQADHAHLAIDGKTLRATCSQPHPVHQLSCYEVATGIVLWHCNVQEKENEISALKPLLSPHLIKGRIFTLDAMHTQRALCAQIHRLAGDYLLLAKDNQPTLNEDIADLFEDRAPDRRCWNHAETWDKGHGRVEHRQITCSPDLNDWFSKQWEGIEQVFRLERTVRLLKTNQMRHEVVYGLSSLSMRQAPPARMLSLIRDHWAIENKLHYRRDVSLGEDGCQTRTGPVPGLLAQLNSTVLSLMDRAGERLVARQMRYFDAHLEQALALVLTGSCSVFENWKALG
jgi:predicted transposase YbfD/YdcC